MPDLKTKYLGIELKNPIIAGASELTANLDKIKRIEDAGAAALVTKSLFEEEIQLERYRLDEELSKYDELHAEMINVFPDIEHAGPDEHLSWVRKAKESVDIPVIGSLNAVNKETWVDYAKQLQQAGVDGLELNFYAVPDDFENAGVSVEEKQLEILKEIKKTVSLPISVKLSPFYSNPLHFIMQLDKTGVNGFVLFNQLFQPDINVAKETHSFPFNLSHEKDHRLPLRFAGLVYDKIKGDICASSGIFSGEDVVKMLLAGANAVQVVSALYRKKIQNISVMLNEIENWMGEKGYEKLDDFRGKLSQQNSSDPWAYKRAQYVKLLITGNPLAD